MASRPLPVPTELTEPYWRAAAEGRLVIQHCRDCDRWIHFPERQCADCGSDDLGWDQVSGRGTVATFSVVHRSFVAGFDGEPYVIAWIDLPEQPGLRVFGNITGCTPDAVRIGLPVELWFERRGEMAMPNFKIMERGEQG
jgi:uncharacterized OB-fold protein